MLFTSRIRLKVGAPLAVALFMLTLAGCHEPPAPATNAPAAANTNAAPATTAPPTNGQTRAPLGMEDTIEGRVIGLLCYKQNRNMTAEQAKACATENAAKGGILAILGADGTVYVNENPDAGVTNNQLKYFIGDEVTIQGQMIGDAPNLNWDDVKVKKFKYGLVRRKGAPAPGTPRQVEPTGKKAEAPAAKKP